MKNIKFEEEKLFTKTLIIFKSSWLYLFILFLFSLASMISAQFSLSSYFADRSGLFILFLFLYIGCIVGSSVFSIKIMKKLNENNCLNKNNLLIVFFIIMLITGLFFSGLFLILEKSNPSIWLLKTSFLGIALMIIHWAIISVVFFSNILTKKLFK